MSGRVRGAPLLAMALALLLPAIDSADAASKPRARNDTAARTARGPSPTAPIITPDAAERARIREEAAALYVLDAASLARLDAMAERYRTGRERTPSGFWRLTALYEGLSSTTPPQTITPAVIQERARILETWIKAHPGSPTPHLAFAILLRNYAYASGVDARQIEDPETGEQALAERLREVRSFLDGQKAIASADPHWYALIAEVMGLQGEPHEKLLASFEEAAQREPLYYPTYYETFHALQGRAGNSAASLAAFADRAAALTKADEGDGLYLRIHWYAAEAIYGYGLFSHSNLDWPRLTKGMADVLARHGDTWNRGHFALMACLATDRDEARKLLASLPTRVTLSAAAPTAVLDKCRPWAVYQETTAATPPSPGESQPN